MKHASTRGVANNVRSDGFLCHRGLGDAMAKAAGIRVRPKETVNLEGVAVTNRTANSILVRKARGGVVVTDCCLEEQGM